MVDTATVSRGTPGLGSARLGLAVLALAVFGAVTTEMLPVGLLPAISRQMGLTASATGLLVSLYAVMVMLLSVPLTLATRRVPGKVLLLATIGSYAVSNLVCALAPNAGLLAAGRALGGLTHAIFFSVCIGYASRLVPASQTGRALALVSSGVAARLILGAPLATALGNAVGWRAGFGALVVLMIAVLTLIALALPSADTTDVAASPVRTGRWRDLVPVMAANALAYLGQYAVYTYVAVLLLRAGATPGRIAPILFLFGGFGLLGIWRAARPLDHRPRRTALIVLLVSGAGMIAVGAGFPSLLLVVVFGVVWNAAFGPAPSLFQSAAIRADAMSPEISGAWLNATANIGIAAGAAFGGLLLNAYDIRVLALAGSIPILAAAAMVLVGHKGFPHSGSAVVGSQETADSTSVGTA
ncbi:MFS transporter [Actinopolymorpha rutila]|uniref:Putative MFS family arabinose efflux permease n=1 Tax=Actinopolymorpha rutila TaxID=446787 RepID=A0A852Z553_9ACTN|nr:MFS transporter [Actinopolymorpha rutila]NYH87971.1 putative MFS family arabinose efflux permease [Actinopolymorpha rutila]